MDLPVTVTLLRQQNYDAALRQACDQLSELGIRNFIHYEDRRRVELLDQARSVFPVIDPMRSVISLAVEP